MDAAPYGDAPSGEEGQAAPTVRVWRVDLQQERAALDLLDEVLRPEERARRDRFRTTSLRDAFTVAHGASTLILAAETGMDARSIRVEHAPCSRCGEPHGKPRLTGQPRCLFFNVAHSSHVALVAVGTDEVGIDVEDGPGVAGLEPSAAWLSPLEAERLLRVSPAERGDELLRTWVRKEAYLKGRGTGLNVDPRTVVLVRDPPELAWRDAGSPRSRWRVFDVEPGGDAVAALAFRHRRVVVQIRYWSAEADVSSATDGAATGARTRGVPRLAPGGPLPPAQMTPRGSSRPVAGRGGPPRIGLAEAQRRHLLYPLPSVIGAVMGKDGDPADRGREGGGRGWHADLARRGPTAGRP